MSFKSEASLFDAETVHKAKAIVKEIVDQPIVRDRGPFKGRGIVICGGGYTYFTNAWVHLKLLRHLGCKLPVQLWHFGTEELDGKMKRILARLDVECIDATPYASSRRGSALKATAIAKSPFEEVLFLDADNGVIRDPAFLFDLPQYRKTGVLFWPDTRFIDEKNPLWKIFDVSYVDEPQIETGQMVIHKDQCWEPLAFAEKLNAHGDAFYRFIYGGKDLFRFAWRKLGRLYIIPEFPPQMLTVATSQGDARDATLCQNDLAGERLFQHRMFCKWDLLEDNPWVSGAFFEGKCHAFLDELRRCWNGRCGAQSCAVNSAKVLRSRRLLESDVWILETTKPPQKEEIPQPSAKKTTDTLADGVPPFVKMPAELGKINFQHPFDKSSSMFRKQRSSKRRQELKFASNGTIIKGANGQTGRFWDVTDNRKKIALLLSSEKGDITRLERVNDGSWKGKSAILRRIHDIYPHLTKRSSLAARVKIARSFGKRVHVACGSKKPGDHILATYACAALCRMGVKVTFHTVEARWLCRIVEPGLTITEKPYKFCRDLNYDLGNQLRYGLSRAAWYSSALHPLLNPARPAVRLDGVIRRFSFDNYIVLSPYAPERDKHWPEAHWTRLANLLRHQGYEIIALGPISQGPTLLRTFSQTQAYWAVGQTQEWQMDALLGASAHIGVDNDLMQVAAMLNVKCVAIHSQMPGSFLWPYGPVRSVNPGAECTFCRWQPERGYLAPCASGCSALATVSPEAVVNALLSLMSRK